MESLAQHIAELLDIEVVALRTLGGGDTGRSFCAETGRGRVFAKYMPMPIHGMFAGEAEGLRRMAAATSIRVPEVLAVRDDLLILEWIERGSPGEDYEARLGAGLAEIHGVRAEAFGFPVPTCCGPTRHDNPWTDDWPTFYRDHRIGPVLHRAAERRAWSSEDRRAGEALLGFVPELLACDPEPPALVHGDLWSGNHFADTDGTPVLVDPAPVFAHREYELGMMLLFGDFGPGVYGALPAMQPGWQARARLYTLYHLLNHDLLFGGGYHRQAMALIREISGPGTAR